MTINLDKIYKILEEHRNNNSEMVKTQNSEYIIEVMEVLGELATSLKNLEKIKNGELIFKDTTKAVFHLTKGIIAEPSVEEITLEDTQREIVKALCKIAALTINAGAVIPSHRKITELDLEEINPDLVDLNYLLKNCGEFAGAINYGRVHSYSSYCFNEILCGCVALCKFYDSNLELAMLENLNKQGFMDDRI